MEEDERKLQEIRLADSPCRPQIDSVLAAKKRQNERRKSLTEKTKKGNIYQNSQTQDALTSLMGPGK